jgi:hypothetical protein
MSSCSARRVWYDWAVGIPVVICGFRVANAEILTRWAIEIGFRTYGC